MVSVRNSESRSGSGAVLGVTFPKPFLISHSWVGIHHYYYYMVKISSQSLFSESHSCNGSRNGSRSRILKDRDWESGLTFQISKLPILKLSLPKRLPKPSNSLRICYGCSHLLGFATLVWLLRLRFATWCVQVAIQGWELIRNPNRNRQKALER